MESQERVDHKPEIGLYYWTILLIAGVWMLKPSEAAEGWKPEATNHVEEGGKVKSQGSISDL